MSKKPGLRAQWRSLPPRVLTAAERGRILAVRILLALCILLNLPMLVSGILMAVMSVFSVLAHPFMRGAGARDLLWSLVFFLPLFPPLIGTGQCVAGIALAARERGGRLLLWGLAIAEGLSLASVPLIWWFFSATGLQMEDMYTTLHLFTGAGALACALGAAVLMPRATAKAGTINRHGNDV